MTQFGLSEEQSNAILEMRLQRLTGLERRKIDEEYAETVKRIEYYRSVLANRSLVLEIIRDELTVMRENYSDQRRTEIVGGEEVGGFEAEDLIADEDVVITISHLGYIKRVPMASYRSQHRGGKGLTGAQTKNDDWVEHLFVASTHSFILLFTNRGRCHWLKVHEIPQAARAARGRSILNIVQIGREDRVTAYVPVREFDETRYLILATKLGAIKKTPLRAYANPRRAGIQAIVLREGDTLIAAECTDGEREIILATKRGKAIRFPESTVRSMGRISAGVRGIRRRGPEDEVVGMVVVRDPAVTLLTVTENGYGKRSQIEDYRITGRGGQGVLNVRISKRNGTVVAIKSVQDRDELMVMSQAGQVIRLRLSQVTILGRATQGVRLIHLEENDRVTDVATIVASEEEPSGQVEQPPDGNGGTGGETQ
jgi:DNA gyrase subunit A